VSEGHDGWEPGDSWSEPGADPGGPAEHGFADTGLGDDGLPPYDDGHAAGGSDHVEQPDHPADPAGAAAAEAHAGAADAHAGTDGDGVSDHGDLHYAVDEAGQQPAGSHPDDAQPDDAPLDGAHAEPAAETTVDTSELAGPAQPVDADPFPAPLGLDVSPSDGQPWVDPDLLGADSPDPDGGELEPPGPPPDPPAALLADLHAADGGDGPAAASALAASDDPAVRALAAFWSR
jgi:hypothetical protein